MNVRFFLRPRLWLAGLGLLAASACAPPPGPSSPLHGTITSVAGQRTVVGYSPTACAAVGTIVRIEILGNEHYAAVGVSYPDVPLSGVEVFAPGGGTMQRTTTSECWNVQIAHDATLTGGDLGGNDVEYVITWPV